MSFEVRVNGESVWKTELQVDQVSVQSARGEIGRMGVAPTDSVVDIVVAEIAAGGPMRLDHLENLQSKTTKEFRRNEKAAGLTADRYNAPDSMHGHQGTPTYTVEEGNNGALSLSPNAPESDSVVANDNDEEFSLEN